MLFVKQKGVYMKKVKCLILMACVMLSCNTYAQRFANEFMSNQRDMKKRDVIYFTPSSSLIRTSLDNTKEIQDTIVLKLINEKIVSELKFYGFEVKQTPAPDSLKNNEHTLAVSQVEIEEYQYYDSIKGELNEKLVFYKKLPAVNVNIWLTYNANRSDELIFYNDATRLSYIDGYFEDETKADTYVDYEIVEINPNDVYEIATDNARLCGKYFFNFLLNQYVFYKSNGEDKNYYGVSYTRSLITQKQPFENFDILQIENE